MPENVSIKACRSITMGEIVKQIQVDISSHRSPPPFILNIHTVIVYNRLWYGWFDNVPGAVEGSYELNSDTYNFLITVLVNGVIVIV